MGLIRSLTSRDEGRGGTDDEGYGQADYAEGLEKIDEFLEETPL